MIHIYGYIGLGIDEGQCSMYDLDIVFYHDYY